jgi:putative flippase GtrA
MTRVTESLRAKARHRQEFLRFAMVGAFTWFVDTGVVYTLKLTLLGEKPLTARIVGVLAATVVSYFLNREWSFRSRGGRRRHHELALFLVCSAIGVGLTVLPQTVSLYVLQIRIPFVSPVTQAVANFVTGQVIGVLLAMVFRFWAFRRFVFPEEVAVRTQREREKSPVA